MVFGFLAKHQYLQATWKTFPLELHGTIRFVVPQGLICANQQQGMMSNSAEYKPLPIAVREFSSHPIKKPCEYKERLAWFPELPLKREERQGARVIFCASLPVCS